MADILLGNVKGPQGDTGATGSQGPQGPGATINVGTVSTTAYGNPVQITNSGTETDAVLDFVIPQGKPGEQTTKMSSLTLDTITTQTAEYPIPAVGDFGSTAWGKIVKFFNDIKTAVTGKVDKTSIVNNLTSTSTDKPLSAAQGKALNDAITNVHQPGVPQYVQFSSGGYIKAGKIVVISLKCKLWQTFSATQSIINNLPTTANENVVIEIRSASNYATKATGRISGKVLYPDASLAADDYVINGIYITSDN